MLRCEAMGEAEDLYAILQPVPEWHELLLDLKTAVPTPDSPYVTDAQHPLSRFLRQGMTASMTSGMDHLMAWSALYCRARLLPAAGHFTLMRSALEGASMTRWMVDPTVDSRVRLARGVGAQLDDLTERRRIERLGPERDAAWWSPGKPATDRIRDLEAEAGDVGIQPERVTYTDAVARFGPGEAAYRILCAFAHGGQAVPMSASRRTVNATTGGDRVVTLEPDIENALAMTQGTAACVLRALREMYGYYGHQLDP